MTIGITALIKPSKILIISLVLMSFFALLSILWAAFLLWHHHYSHLIITTFFMIGLMLMWFLWKYWGSLKIIQLEITNKGDMLLRYLDKDGNIEQFESETVQLQANTVLLPFLMVVLLKTHHGNRLSLPIFPDSVEGNTFRKLSVALRWISVRSHE